MKPCIDCHSDKPLNEFTKNHRMPDGYSNLCKKCNVVRVTKWREQDPERFRNSRKQTTKKHWDSISEYKREYRAENQKRQKIWRRQWTENNRGRKRFLQAQRRARLLNATPKWVDREAIAVIYNNCPAGYHVDHVIPLKGKNICGLHVPWNLQYLPAIENIRKGNR